MEKQIKTERNEESEALIAEINALLLSGKKEKKQSFFSFRPSPVVFPSVSDEIEAVKNTYISGGAGKITEPAKVAAAEAAAEEKEKPAAGKKEVRVFNPVFTRPAPAEVPAERQCPAMFVYSDEKFCEKFLNDLDRVCLEVLETPVFVNRVGVAEFNSYLGTDVRIGEFKKSGALSLIYLGDFPEETLKQLGAACIENGISFSSYSRHTAADEDILDLVLKLITLR